MSSSLFTFSALFAAAFLSQGAGSFETDTFQTPSGPLKITFVGHGTLCFELGGKVIHVDPVGEYADYSNFPKADLILVTHEHHDHMDLEAIEKIRTETTKIVLTDTCAGSIPGGVVMENGDVQTVEGIRVEAVPAYNIVHMRGSGVPFQPKGRGNGYVVAFGDKRVYIAGDTENTPEMKTFKSIDIMKDVEGVEVRTRSLK